MSIYASVITGGSNSHQTTAEEANYHATDFVSEGVVGAITNTSGVAPSTGAFAVNAQGTPDMTVAVSSGVAYVTATPTGGSSQAIRIYNNATSNVTIAANSSGSTKYDWVYVKVDPDAAANPASDASDVGSLVTSRSSSASSDDGTPPTYGYAIAVVTVSNGASSITNGNISDVRIATGFTPPDGGASPTKWTNPYCFQVKKSSNQTGVADATQTVVTFDTETYDYNDDFTSNTYTAPVNGVYNFNAYLTLSGTTISDYYLELYVNSTTAYPIGRGTRGTSDNNQFAFGGRDILLNAGDTVKLRVFSNVGSGTTTVSSTDSYFAGHLVRKT